MRAAMLYAAAAIELAGIVTLAQHALGAPPVDAREELRDYYRGLQYRDSNGNTHGCCDESDCRETESRQGPNGRYEVLIDQRFPGFTGEPFWLDVPPEVVVRRPNVPGQPVACWRLHIGLMCFNPVPEV